jgi:outer membrane protein
MKFLICTTAFLLVAAHSASDAHARQLPKWEVGIGIAGLNLPDYRGADERTTYALPVPYLIYRGDRIRADREGLRGILLDSERLTLNISVNGTLPVSDENNRTRSGMGDLQPTVEIGPSLDLRLWHSPDGRSELDLRLPVRGSVAIDSSLRHIGWLAFPNLYLKIRSPFGMNGWTMGMTGGSYIADRGYNAYFYSVAPSYATPARPAYEASGGYGGSQFTWSLSKRFKHYWTGFFVRYDTLSGAVFEESPLVRKRNAVSAGFAIGWIFKTSAVMVSEED